MNRNSVLIAGLCLASIAVSQVKDSTASVRGRAKSMSQVMRLAIGYDGESIPVAFGNLNPRIVLRDAKRGTLHAGPDGNGYPISEKGEFVCHPVPAGKWQLLLRYNKPSKGSRGGAVFTMPHVLCETEVGREGEEKVAVDLGPLLPTAVHGKVFLNGVLVQPSSIGFDAAWPDVTGQQSSFHAVHFSADFERKGGGYRLRGLPPGNHTFSISMRGADGRPRMFYTFEPVRLVAGEDRELDLYFDHRIARVRLVGPDGAPVANRVVWFGSQHSERATTDAEGWFTVDPVRQKEFVLEAYRKDVDMRTVRELRHDDPRLRRSHVGEVRVNLRRQRTEVTLTVPAVR